MGAGVSRLRLNRQHVDESTGAQDDVLGDGGVGARHLAVQVLSDQGQGLVGKALDRRWVLQGKEAPRGGGGARPGDQTHPPGRDQERVAVAEDLHLAVLLDEGHEVGVVRLLEALLDGRDEAPVSKAAGRAIVVLWKVSSTAGLADVGLISPIKKCFEKTNYSIFVNFVNKHCKVEVLRDGDALLIPAGWVGFVAGASPTPALWGFLPLPDPSAIKALAHKSLSLVRKDMDAQVAGPHPSVPQDVVLGAGALVNILAIEP